MSQTWEDLKNYIGTTKSDQDTYIESCFDDAQAMISDVLTGGVVGGSQTFRPLPAGLADRCTLVVGKELYKSRNEPGQQGQYAQTDQGVPVRAPLDPMTRVKPLLARYVVPF